MALEGTMRLNAHRPTRLLVLGSALSLTGCLYLFPRDIEPPYPDRGTELSQNPYDHRNAPEYSKGRIDGFRELFVDADAFADAMVPAGPRPATAAEPTETIPENITSVLVVTAKDGLREGRTFEDLVAAISGESRIVLSMPENNQIALVAPSEADAAKRLLDTVANTKVDGERLKTIAEVGLAEALPESMLSAAVISKSDDGGTYTLGSAPPPAPEPETGKLPLNNITTSYATITINDKPVGVVPPLARASVSSVKTGIYTVSWELPNGYTWTETTATLDPAAPVAAQ